MTRWTRTVPDFPEPGRHWILWLDIPDLQPGDQVYMSHGLLMRLLTEAGYAPDPGGPDSPRRRDADAPPAP